MARPEKTPDPFSRSIRKSKPAQIARLLALRDGRDHGAFRTALAAVTRAAADGSNLVPPIMAAVEARATVGEIADAMRSVFGEFESDIRI